MKYFIKVKNILGKNKNITLLNGDTYNLKDKDEKIIGEYSDDVKPIIFKLLKTGFEVSKILEENIQDYMKIDTSLESSQMSSNDEQETLNNNNSNEEKPKKRRGRPPKNK